MCPGLRRRPSGCRSRRAQPRPPRLRGHRGALVPARLRPDLLDVDVPGDRKGPDGAPAIPATAHVRLAHASGLGGIRILRRGYTFTDGTDGVGHLDAGLFFIAFVRDAGAQFVPMQRALAQADGLNEYIELNGSAVFACPPGTHPGQWWGQALFT